MMENSQTSFSFKSSSDLLVGSNSQTLEQKVQLAEKRTVQDFKEKIRKIRAGKV
jgi:hypothetical protein